MLVITLLGEYCTGKDKASVCSVDIRRTTVETRHERTLKEIEAGDLKPFKASGLPGESDPEFA